MAYFANGTEGELYEARYCARCVHNREVSGARLRRLAWELEAAADAFDRAVICGRLHPDPDLYEVRCRQPGGHTGECIGRTKTLGYEVRWMDVHASFPPSKGPDYIARGWWCRLGPRCGEIEGAACSMCYPGPGDDDRENWRIARRDARRQKRLKQKHGVSDAA